MFVKSKLWEQLIQSNHQENTLDTLHKHCLRTFLKSLQLYWEVKKRKRNEKCSGSCLFIFCYLCLFMVFFFSINCLLVLAPRWYTNPKLYTHEVADASEQVQFLSQQQQSDSTAAVFELLHQTAYRGQGKRNEIEWKWNRMKNFGMKK